MADAKVWVANPHPFGRLDGGMVSVEGWLGGGLSMAELRERFVVDGVPVQPIGEILRDHPTAAWGWVRTDAAGAFEIGGLLPQDYELAVMQDGSLARADAGPFRAGTRGVLVRLPRVVVHPVVAGRVVSRGGEPVPGVQVRAQCDPVRLPYETGGASTMHAAGVATGTDAEGRFRLERVGAERVYLRLDGERIVPLEYGRGVAGGVTAVDGDPPDDLTIVVSLRVHVRIEFADPLEADEMVALDADGQVRPIDVFEANGRTTTSSLRFRLGRTPVMVLTDDVTAIRLRKAGRDLRTVAVVLRPGEVNELRF